MLPGEIDWSIEQIIPEIKYSCGMIRNSCYQTEVHYRSNDSKERYKRNVSKKHLFFETESSRENYRGKNDVEEYIVVEFNC